MNRWVVGLASVAVIAVVGFMGWDKIVNKAVELERDKLKAENAELLVQKEVLETRNRKLDLAVTMLTFQERRAFFRVIRTTDEEKPLSLVHWLEVDKEGKAIGDTQERELLGPNGFVHARVIAFTDNFVMEDDPLKNKALVVFDKICGSSQALDDVPPLKLCSPYESLGDGFGFEKKMWARFEQLATSNFEADQYGVRYAQYSSAGKPLKPGVTYKVLVRATGEIYMTPLKEEEAQKVVIPPPPGAEVG